MIEEEASVGELRERLGRIRGRRKDLRGSESASGRLARHAAKDSIDRAGYVTVCDFPNSWSRCLTSHQLMCFGTHTRMISPRTHLQEDVRPHL